MIDKYTKMSYHIQQNGGDSVDRMVLHSDLNNFYASVECLLNPSLRDRPVAVAGSEQMRHGIVLAKNEIAKKCGVVTGEPLWSARQKCSEIIFVEPHFSLYREYSQIVQKIYGEYTDRVEPYGPDECWLDVTDSFSLFGDGKQIADALRQRLKKEIGLTVSVGVSFNKVFSKLGSDMKKPDATTVITRSDFREKVWPLEAEKMLYVGRASGEKLRRYGMYRIGDIAKAPRELLRSSLGKNGMALWYFANGMDDTPVGMCGEEEPIQSVGHGVTCRRDLKNEEDVKIVLLGLCEMVSARLREHGKMCSVVQLSMRDTNLVWCERQKKLIYPNRTVRGLFEAGMALYVRHNGGKTPLRSIGIRGCNLTDGRYEQLSLDETVAAIQRRESLDAVADRLRQKFGTDVLTRARVLEERELGNLNPNETAQMPGRMRG